MPDKRATFSEIVNFDRISSTSKLVSTGMDPMLAFNSRAQSLGGNECLYEQADTEKKEIIYEQN